MKSVVLIGSIALFSLATTAGAAGAAAPEAQVAATVKQAMENFNKGDIKAVTAAMSPDGISIIDEISPYIWSGANAFDTWFKAFGDYEKANGVTDDAFTAGKPTRIAVSGDRAYAVQPVVYNFKQNGAPMQESSRMVYSLQKVKGGWLITGWAWAGGTPKAVAVAAGK
jgi:ketosteroid isomerase-like protein